MFVPFLIAAVAIITVGPMENEGLSQSIQDIGLKKTISMVIDTKEPLDYPKLNP